jgi:hypothetical protein
MDRFGFRLVVGVAAIATLIAVGAYTYNLGVARGLVESEIRVIDRFEELLRS